MLRTELHISSGRNVSVPETISGHNEGKDIPAEKREGKIMTIREYGAFATGILGAVFGFDIIWNLTQLDAFEAFFVALFIGFAAVAVYAFVTEPKQESKPAYTWVTDQTGLSVMVKGDRS